MTDDRKRWPHEDPKHMADVDLRMVQVGAVAVGREALRLAGEVRAGRLPFQHAAAVLAGAMGLPVHFVQVLLADEPLRAAACFFLGEKAMHLSREEARQELAKVLAVAPAQTAPHDGSNAVA